MVSLILVMFITFYANTIDTQLQTLDELYTSIDVPAQMTNWNGTSTANLNVSEDFITVLVDSGFIGQEFYTRNLLFLTVPWDEDNPLGMVNKLLSFTPKLIGANDIRAIPDFAHDKAIVPEFMDGFDEALFTANENVAIVSTDFLLTNGLSLSDEVQLTVVEESEYYNPHDLRNKHGQVTLKIVGQYESSMISPPVYIPWNTMSEIYNDLDISPQWDSARFILQDTKNLDQLRALLLDHGFNFPSQRDENRDPAKPGFVIQDRILNTATGSVTNYVDFMMALYPFIYLLCAVIGFLVSYLLIRIRKPEFAIMRSMGTSRLKTFISFFFEQSALSTIGIGLSLAITLVITGSITLVQTYSILGYLFSYWVGTAFAILMMNRGNVIQILSAKE